MKTASAAQVMHGQDADTVADVADAHLVRADTEHVLGGTNHLAERTTLGNLHAWTPYSPGGRNPLESSTRSKECPTWRAHHQDFYASKWFRSIQIFTICSVIIVALILYMFVSPAFVDVLVGDIFSSFLIIGVLLPVFLGPVAILLLIVVGGMRWSKIFQ